VLARPRASKLRGIWVNLERMILSLHHADLIIPRGADERARDFYCRLLQIPEIEKPDVLKPNGGLWLQLGPHVQLHLSYEKKEGVDPRKTKAHVALQVRDLDAVERALREAGCPVKHQEQLPGQRRLESEDPFGHRLEFLQLL
jgi:catechol 2,3-dioxygenase-like lactoylglutathione lyase family enzyme